MRLCRSAAPLHSGMTRTKHALNNFVTLFTNALFRTVRQKLKSHSSGFGTSWTNELNIRTVKLSFNLGNPAFWILLAWPAVNLQKIKAFDHDTVVFRKHPEYFSFFALFFPSQNLNQISLFKLHAITWLGLPETDRPCIQMIEENRLLLLNQPSAGSQVMGSSQTTSGASDTIFAKFKSLNSRATGPKIRVPRGFC